MKYRIIAYIPVEMPEIFDTKEEAEEQTIHLSFLQPDNKYEVSTVYEDED